MKLDDELKALIKRKIELQKWDEEEALHALLCDISYAELDDALAERLKIKEEDLN